MINIFKRFLGLFVNFFKIVEENRQVNVIRSISKDKEGYTVVFLSPITSEDSCQMYPFEIINQDFIKDQLRKSDIKILQSIITTEGDIHIGSKEYRGEKEVYTLRSVLSDEVWILTESELTNNKDVFNRLNKRYFYNYFNTKHFTQHKSKDENHGK